MRHALWALVLLAPTRALALDPDLGARGQVVVTDNLRGGASWRGYDVSGAQFVNLTFAPSIDYFVVKHVSVGLDADIAYSDTHAYDASSRFVQSTGTFAQVGARVGLNVPLGRWLSIWPRATAYFAWAQGTSANGVFGEQTTTTTSTARLTLFVPLVMQLRSHLFVGVGPVYSHEFIFGLDPKASTTEANDIAVGTMLGGYTGGDSRATPDEPHVEWRAFGSEHEIALDGGASIFWYGSADGLSKHYGGSVSIGLDWFVVDRISIGVGFSSSYDRYDTGSTSEYWSFGVGPRVGYDVPISRFLSFYPRVALGFGVSSYDLRAAGTQNASTSLIVNVAAYAPLLFHVAPHFYIGCGPTVSRELVDKDPSTTAGPNNATTVGASLGVGGWL